MYRTHNARVGIRTHIRIVRIVRTYSRVYNVLVLVLVLRVAYTLILYKTSVRVSRFKLRVRPQVESSRTGWDRSGTTYAYSPARTLARLLFRPSSRPVPTFAPAHSQSPHPHAAHFVHFSHGSDRAAVSLSVRKGEPCYSRRIPQSSQFFMAFRKNEFSSRLYV